MIERLLSKRIVPIRLLSKRIVPIRRLSKPPPLQANLPIRHCFAECEQRDWLHKK